MAKRLSKEEVQERISKNFTTKVTLIGEYVNKRTPIKLKCEECGYIWKVKPHNVLYTDDVKSRIHRCPNCSSIHEKRGKYFKCAYCGKEIYRSESQIKKNISGYFYCSKDCGNRHKNIIKFESGEFDDSKNYRLKAMLNYEHKCKNCGWDEDDRILEVHHIDSNRDNNSLDNLVILCPTCHRKITLGYYYLDNLDFKIKKL